MLLPRNVFEALMHFRKSVSASDKENIKSNPMNSIMDEIFKMLSIFPLLNIIL